MPTARLQSLDVLRALAVLLVVGRHMGPAPSASPAVSRMLAVWQRGGWIGVDLFFVLSGFLVSGLLFREFQRYGEVRILPFLARRGLKIYPAFYVFITATILLRASGLGHGDVSASRIAAECFFVQNYFTGLHEHTWSLAVEEHFYFLCAVLVLTLTVRAAGHRDPFRGIPHICAAVVVVVLLMRVVNAWLRPYTNYTHLYPTHLRIEGLLFGVCLAYLHHFKREFLDRWLAGKELAYAALGTLLLLPAFVFQLETTPAIFTIGLTSFYVGSGLLVVAAVRRGLPSNGLTHGLGFVGEYSYSIYLWHTTAMAGVHRVLSGTRFHVWWISLPAVIAAVAVVGIGMAKLVEMPVLRLRDRIFPSRLGRGDAVAMLPPHPATADRTSRMGG